MDLIYTIPGENNKPMPLIQMLCSILMALVWATPTFAEQWRLESVHEEIKISFPAVKHITVKELERKLGALNNLLVFDVREPDEYDVSHLHRAIRIDPEIDNGEFERTYGEQISNKTVVFYCSVGRRSSILANNLSDTLMSRGATGTFNLKHGIFGWHNQQKILYANTRKTDHVHPYNHRWSRLIKRKDKIRYSLD